MAITNLHLEVTGDCSGAISALGSTEAAIEHLSGKTAGISASLSGSDNVIRDLNQIGAMRDAIASAPAAAVAVDSSGISAARGEMRGLGADVRGTADDFRNATGVLSGIGASAGVSDLIGQLGTAGAAARGVSLGAGLGGASRASQDVDQLTASLASAGDVSGDVLDPLKQASLVMAGGGEGASMMESARASSSAVRGLSSDLSGAARQAGGLTDQVIAMNRGLDNGGGLTGAFAAVDSRAGFAGIPGTIDGPPKPPRGGGGGGGGGDGGGFIGGLIGDGDDSMKKALKPSMSGLMMPGMVALAGGAVGEMVGAGAGLEAVNKVIGLTPGLALESNRAMNALDTGIRSASVGALSAGVPAFEALDKSMKPLGQEIGRIGTGELGDVLGGVKSLADDATQSLTNLAPAVGPATRGALSLADALVQGIGGPGVTAGVSALGTALQNPQTMAAVSGLTSSVIGGGAQLLAKTAPLIQAVGDVGSGQYYADHSGGALNYNASQDYGGAPVPGGGGGTSWDQSSRLGRIATAGGAALSLAGTTAYDTVRGAYWGAQGPGEQAMADRRLDAGTSELGARWDNIQHPGSAVPPSAAEGPSRGGADMFSQVSSGYREQPSASSLFPPVQNKTGYSEDSQGNYTPLPRSAGPSAPPTGSPVFRPDQLTPGGPGSSVMSMPASAAQQLNQSISQTQQASNQAAPPLQNYGQSALSAANRVQQLGQSSTQTFQGLNQASSSATTQLSSASSSINEGSQALGSSVPQSMADGVNSNVGVACDATANLGAAAKNCGASALQAASPSKAFVELGVGIGDGLAIGVNSSAGTATSAVSQAMASVVSAGQAGLAAASPSKTFQNLGQNLVGQPNIGQIQQQATQQVQQAQQAAQQAQQQAMSRQSPFASDNQLRNQQQQKQDASLQNLPFDVQNQIKSGQPLSQRQQQEMKDQSDRQSNQKAFQNKGWSPSEEKSVLDRMQGHNDRAETLREGRNTLHDNAVNLAKHPTADARSAMENQGSTAADAYAKGIGGGQDAAGKAGGGLADSTVAGTKKKLGSNSPSVVMMGVGEDVSAGLSIGIAGSADSVAAVASNSGLMVGYMYGESVTTGALSVIQSAQFQSAAVSGVGSQLAEAVLGADNMLGPAPSGGEIYKNSAVTMGSSSSSSTVTPTVNVGQIVAQFGNQTIQAIAQQVVDATMSGLNDTLQLQ